ncbi:aldo/keto reductase [Tabrizicola sp.]|uniref:aldo/keto reductase n=1 Tax=Tabrizicola sp. TaxID=2005166 RepID=UPI00286C6322|nr:aldo/keto reductase [Tabrizicola sp.]
MLIQTLWDGTTVPRLGLGCWAIGGPWTAGGAPAGWGEVDDAESVRAIHAAVAAGMRVFDTAQAYGAGHSERVLGQALRGHPEVRVATKVGLAIDPARRALIGEDLPGIAASIDASLRRLQRGRIDLVLLHVNSLPISEADTVFETLEALRCAGKIAAYGWSTDFPDRAMAFAERPGFVAVEHAMNVFFRAEALLPVIEAAGLLSINRSPLAMGVLGGRIAAGARFGAQDVRSRNADWMAYFKDGQVTPDLARQLDAVRDLLQTGGRSLAQGAIGWLWARSGATLPIPGFRTVAQVEDLAGALAFGALPAAAMAAIETVIERAPEGPPRER